MEIITFDKTAKKFILDTFDKIIDGENYVVEKNNPKQRVLTQDGQEVEFEKFAGIKKGSEIYIKSDILSLIKLSDEINI